MRPVQPSKFCRERGSVTVMAIFATLLIFALTYSTMEHGLAERRDVVRTQDSLAALQLAEYGLAKAEIELQSQTDADGDGLGTIAGSTRDGGSYEVDANQVAGDMWVLTSIGQHGLSVRRLELGLEVSTSFVFKHAVFAKDDLYIDSSVATDAFDSGKGTWASQAVNNDSLGDYAESTGHVGSNANIDVHSSVRIRGDARAGTSSRTKIHGSSAKVYGNTAPMDAPFSAPNPPRSDFEDAYANNNNGEISSGSDIYYDGTRMNLRVDGSATLTLSGGTYFFNDLELNSSSRLRISSPTVIYVTGDLKLTSSVSANISGSAKDLSFICHPYNISPGWSSPSDPIELNSSLEAALTIYAPARDIYMDSSVRLFGAVVGSSIEVNSSVQVHYDRALGGGAGGAATTRRSYWREPVPPVR